MSDAPLLVGEQTWRRIEKVFAAVLQARHPDVGQKVRITLAALVRARRKYTYEIDAASLMLTSHDWIPVEGVHEIPLVQALISQRRRFLKPLRYDARSVAAFPSTLLLDAGPTPVALHLVSSFMTPADRATKDRSIGKLGAEAWSWHIDQAMPASPASTLVT